MNKVVTASDLLEAALQLQISHADTRSCAHKRQDRVPQQARELFARSAECGSEEERKQFSSQAAGVLRAHLRAVAALNLFDKVRTGKAPVSATNLKNIEALMFKNADGECRPVVDQKVWASDIAVYFRTKWTAVGGQAELDAILHAGEGTSLDLVATNMCQLFDAIKNQRKLDGSGISVYALRILCTASPQVFATCLDQLLTSTSFCKQICIHGFVKGKGTAKPMVTELRSVMPLPAIL